MTRIISFVICAAILTSCARKEQASAPPLAPEEAKRNATDWTAKTELYLEYPPLVTGKTGRFAIHLTRLDNFKALAAGRAEVVLRAADGKADTFPATGPSSPGIFGADVRPGTPGQYRMLLNVAAPDFTDTHDLGMVTVFADEKAAAAEPEAKPKEETIAFLKEQQWSLEFGTEVVRERSLHESVTIPGQIIARAGGEAEVSVPFDGRVVSNQLPAPGTEVQKDQVLAQIVPPIENPASIEELEYQRAEAEAALNLARKESARVERLVSAGAVPARRVDEAQTAEITAAARLRAAQGRIAHYEDTRNATGPGEMKPFMMRAPITGIVAETHATTGAIVKSGETLFKLVDISSVYAEGKLPESELPRISKMTGAQLEVPGSGRVVPLRRLISLGRLVDPATRTVNLIYEAGNAGRTLAVGQAISLRLTTAGGAQGVAVPESAIVDDGGRPVLFVQLAGETFARRPVTLGMRDADYVQVLSGVRPGERVVTRGAYLIRLSAMSAQIPAHGHVH
jgi:RND family efflux transporter MFP subunit